MKTGGSNAWMGRNLPGDSAGSSGVGFWRGRVRCGWNRQTTLRYFSGVVSGFTHHSHGSAKKRLIATAERAVATECGWNLSRCKLKENETYEAL
jgi:hypothetical protein